MPEAALTGWGLLLGCAAATYLWRALGVLLAGHLSRDSAVFEWLTCVTYAMLAGLVVRVLVLPVGMLAETALAHRAIACAVAVGVLYAPRGSLLTALLAGTGAMMLLASPLFA